jgi:hypothetical protein
VAIAAVGTPTDGVFAFGTLTFSYTVIGGSDDIVIIAATKNGADNLTTVDVGGTNAPLIAKFLPVSGGRNIYLYGCLNPPTGSQTVTVNSSGADLILAGCSEYTGINTTTYDAIDTGEDVVGASKTMSVTTVTDNSWTFLNFATAGDSTTAGTGSTFRVDDANFHTWSIYDSGGAITPAGSYSMTVNVVGGTIGIAWILVSLPPAGGGGNTDTTWMVRQQRPMANFFPTIVKVP